LFTGAAQKQLQLATVAELQIPLPPERERERLIAAMDVARAERRAKLAKADALLSGLDDFLLNTLDLTKPPKDDCKVFAVRLRDIGKRADSYSNQSRFRKLFTALHKSKYQVAKFSELTERIFSGITPLAKGDAYVSPPDGVRFIRSGEITDDGEVATSSEVHINSLIHEKMMKRSQLQRGDLLIAIVGATIGSTGVFNRDEPANINQAIAAVRLPDTDISPEFACLFLHSSIGQALLDYFKRPVARANINLEEIGEIPMIIPPKPVQTLIVEESHHRRDQARSLRAEAEAGWQKAKLWFEEQLLGTAKP
jgi:type I restriction enzyme S subunit